MNTPGNICDGCGLQFTLDPANTVVHYFGCQPWFSYGQTHCPQCHIPARLFWRDQNYMDYFIINNFPFEAADFADDFTVGSFESVYGLHPIAEVPLTPRLELEVHNLHTILENIPDDLLVDILQTPQAHDKPETWL